MFPTGSTDKLERDLVTVTVEKYNPSTPSSSVEKFSHVEELSQDDLAPQKIDNGEGQITFIYKQSQFPPDSELARYAANNDDKITYTQSEVKKLLRQYDKHILTFVSFLYFLSHLDRGNIGNAKLAGMQKDLNFEGRQFELIVIMFFVGYICFQWGILLWKIVKPSHFVPWIILGWGIVSTCCAAVQNWKQLLVLRVILGIFEACFSPGIYYYFSFFYHREEIAKRIGGFQCFSPISSAISGVIAYGITNHAPKGIVPWRLLFIVEGAPTILGGLIAFFAIINSPHSCWFLSEKQKLIAQARTLGQSGSVNRGGHGLNKKEIIAALLDFKIWANTILFFCITMCQVPLPIFLPSIIEGMGYQNIEAQGMTSPPYLVAVIAILTVCYFSDRYLKRAFFLVASLALAAVGYILLAVSPVTGGRYFGLYLAVPGVYAALAMIMAWTGDNQGSDSKRGVGYVILHVFGMTGPIVGTFLFPDSERPHYRKGIWVTFGIVIFTIVFGAVYGLYLFRENKKLDKKHGPADPKKIRTCSDDTQKDFRYVI
ncbi:uncharacterized protein SAPINGB_P000903 [Magnusiomyces paraingens]|uniref:Major facilitator superfamily (MFS) profile domain-containing protein n=1 Tax=Magnusiomyces paraingens TaxID=2606893 RepID=A0A5E8B4R1_9ASCO|nr:uncharacterized protein SAPINGB_P000903 [Saprochaete ingens]VVT45812.1 unnamed protein product [Saprochaete ingens]